MLNRDFDYIRMQRTHHTPPTICTHDEDLTGTSGLPEQQICDTEDPLFGLSAAIWGLLRWLHSSKNWDRKVQHIQITQRIHLSQWPQAPKE